MTTHRVIDELTGIIAFEGTQGECIEFIDNHDNGFLNLYP